MTPAINILKKVKISHIIHEYVHDAAHESYGLEAAEKLDVDPKRVFKTLVVSSDKGDLAVAVLPVSSQLNMKQTAKILKVKKVAMADPHVVQRSTGYVLGGVSPLGQKKSSPTIVDISAKNFPTIFISAGRRGLEIELNANDLVSLLNASLKPIVD